MEKKVSNPCRVLIVSTDYIGKHWFMQPENTDKRLAELEEKWLKGTITTNEAEEYASWYNAHQGDPLELPAAYAVSKEEHRKRMLRNINAAKKE